MLIKSFFRFFSFYWSLDIHITHSSQAERGDRCHAARPLNSWRYVRPLQWLWVNWLVRLATGALASWRGLVRTRLSGPSHSSVIGKSRAVTDGETLTPQAYVEWTFCIHEFLVLLCVAEIQAALKSENDQPSNNLSATSWNAILTV